MSLATRGRRGYQGRISSFLVGIAALLQSAAAADDSTFRIREHLPPCLEFPSPVCVSNEGELNSVLRKVEETYSEYSSLGHSCEVEVLIKPSPSVYRLHAPVTLSGVSLRLTKSSDASAGQGATGEAIIEAPPGRRAFLIRNNVTQFVASGITFTGGDLSSSAAIWGSKKSYDTYLVSSGLGHTAYATSGENPLFESSSEGATNASPLYNSRYAGSMHGATRFDVISADSTPMFDRKKQATTPVLVNADEDCDGFAERHVGATKWGNIKLTAAISAGDARRKMHGAPKIGEATTLVRKTGTVKFKQANRITFKAKEGSTLARKSYPSSCSARERRWSGVGTISHGSTCLERLDDGSVALRSRGIINNIGTGGAPPATRTNFAVLLGGETEDCDDRDSVTGAAFIASEASEAQARRTAATMFLYRESGGLTRGPLANGVGLEELSLADASAAAGGLFSIRNASVLFTDCTFTDSVALLGGALHMSRASTARLEGCSFSRCKALEDGGAVFLDSSSLLSVHRSVFSDGVADNGGAVCATEGSRVVATLSWFVGNTGRRCGGALHLDDEASMLYCESCALTQNSAENGGGACVGRSSLADFGFTRFTENRALHSGGAFFTEPSSITRVSRSVFDGSSAFFGKDGYVYGSLPYFDVYAPDPTNPPSILTHTVAKQTQGATFGELAAQVPPKDPPKR